MGDQKKQEAFSLNRGKDEEGGSRRSTKKRTTTQQWSVLEIFIRGQPKPWKRGGGLRKRKQNNLGERQRFGEERGERGIGGKETRSGKKKVTLTFPNLPSM